MQNPNLNSHHLALEFDKILSNLSNYANSTLGQKASLNLEILNKKAQIEYELTLVDEAKKIIDDNGSSAPIDNLTSLSEIYKQNYFTSEEIIELAKNLRCARVVKNYISKNENALNLNEIVKNF